MSKRLEQLKDFLEYNPETGLFTWIKSPSRSVPAGRIALCQRATGRSIAIRFGGKLYQAHRLAWFYMTGEWPTFIDHRNGDQADNRWSNLREATLSQNQANKRISKTNKTGFKSVLKHSHSPRFVARIKANGKNIHLGMFDTAEEAHEAYLSAARKFYGEFANGG